MERKHYLDFMKGIAAVLVVIQHIFITGTDSKSGIFIAWFHNPVFFLVSGILFYYSLEKQKDASPFKLYAKAFLSLLIPFFIWNIIDIAFCLAFKIQIFSFVSNAAWFLAVLFLAHCFIITIKNIPNKVALFVIPVLLFGGMIISAFYISFLAKICTFTLIVYLGYLIAHFPPAKKTSFIITGLLLLSLSGLIILAVTMRFSIADGIKPGIRLIVNMIADIICACTVLFIVKLTYGLIEKVPITKFFALLGQYTLYIYLIPFPLMCIISRFCNNAYILFLASILVPLWIGILIKGTLIDHILFNPYHLFIKK